MVDDGEYEDTSDNDDTESLCSVSSGGTSTQSNSDNKKKSRKGPGTYH